MSNDTLEKYARPLDDGDVARESAIYSKLSEEKQAWLDTMFQENRRTVYRLISSVSGKLNNDSERADIDRIRAVLKICPDEELFIRLKDKLYAAREEIYKKNIEFFLDRDYKAFIKVDHKKQMIESILQIVKHKSKELTEEEREIYWKYVFQLLQNVIQYELIMCEYR